MKEYRNLFLSGSHFFDKKITYELLYLMILLNKFIAKGITRKAKLNLLLISTMVKRKLLL